MDVSATHPRLAAVPAAPQDDDALLRAFLDGNPRAFEELVKRYQQPVYGLCRRYAPRPDDARDLAQRAFLRAFAAARRARLSWRRSEPFPFRAWLFRIAINLSKNHARDGARWQLVPLEHAAERADEAPGANRLEREERTRRLRAAVVDLPRREREVFTLRVDAELPFAEVAATLGITENNAKVTFHHAMKRLQGLIRAAEDEP